MSLERLLACIGAWFVVSVLVASLWIWIGWVRLEFRHWWRP